MSKRKICVVITARPSYSRIKSALRAIQQHPELELVLVVTASALLDRYGSAIEVIEQDGFKVDFRVYTVVESAELAGQAKTTGLGIIELSNVFNNEKPDAVVTIADRYETMATAVAAAYMNIPLVHIQGGEVTGNIDEKVRHAITKLADLHLVATERAQQRIIKMGEATDSVHVTGCPSIDLAHEVAQAPALNFDPYAKYGGVGRQPDLSNGYLVVLQHPVTSEHDQARQHIEETLHAVEELGLPTCWFWPNVDAGSDGTSRGIRAFREQGRGSNIQFFKNMEPADFLRLLANCSCLIGNSSAAIRECAFLGVPAVNIGSRQDGRDRAENVADADYNRASIVSVVQQQMQHGKFAANPIYGSGNAGQQIADIIAQSPLHTHKKLGY